MKRFITVLASSQESVLQESHEQGRFHTARVINVSFAMSANSALIP
jgi:hypothetical protein